MSLLPVVTALVGMGVSCLMIPLILRQSERKLFLVRPADLHNTNPKPIPRLGGVALALAFLSIEAFVLFAAPHYRAELTGRNAVVFASIAMFALGLWDDLRGLGARKKLVGQILIAAGFCCSGIFVEELRIPVMGHVIQLHGFGVPVTIFWLVGMTNLINFIDGADGLAGGICLMLMVLLAVLGHQTGGMELLAAGMAGALLGFLWYNFPPARIYLGDGGAYLVGFQIGLFSLVNSRKGEVFAALSAPMFVLALPILDTTLAILRRGLWGLSIFRPDRRHLHHHLRRIGFSSRKIVLSFYGVTLVFLALGFASIWLRGEWLPGLVGIGALVIIVCADNLSFSREWFNIGHVLGDSFEMRKEVKYALSLMQWLQMEGGRCASLDDLWVDFVFSARKLGFSSAKLTLADGQRFWVDTNNRLIPARWVRHELDGGRSGALELEAPCEFSPSEGQAAGLAWAWEHRHFSRVSDPKSFEVLSELLAEGWMKAAKSWSPHWSSPSDSTRAVIPEATTSGGSPRPRLRPARKAASCRIS
jgi:UDP-GlcNAc:undecaprenyl-phosphate GlcNAc-1-phosphate transferase